MPDVRRGFRIGASSTDFRYFFRPESILETSVILSLRMSYSAFADEAKVTGRQQVVITHVWNAEVSRVESRHLFNAGSSFSGPV